LDGLESIGLGGSSGRAKNAATEANGSACVTDRASQQEIRREAWCAQTVMARRRAWDRAGDRTAADKVRSDKTGVSLGSSRRKPRLPDQHVPHRRLPVPQFFNVFTQDCRRTMIVKAGDRYERKIAGSKLKQRWIR